MNPQPTASEINEQERDAFDAFDMAFMNLRKHLAELEKAIEQVRRDKAAADKAYEEWTKI